MADFKAAQAGSPKTSSIKKQVILICAVILLAIGVGGYFGATFAQSIRQPVQTSEGIFGYASRHEEAAQPIEAGITEAGGVKKCTIGRNGGFNTQGHVTAYNAFFEVPLPRDKAIEMIKEVARNSGFTLTHASEARGPVPVADIYLENWYYDTTSKPNPFTELGNGNIYLFLTVDNETTNLTCDGLQQATINAGDNVTAIGLRLGLPSKD